MNVETDLSIFLPFKVLSNLSCSYLYGFESIFDSNRLINCIISLETKICPSNTLKLLNPEINANDNNDESQIHFVGVIYSTKKKQKIDIPKLNMDSMWFVIRVDMSNNGFYLEKISLNLSHFISVRIILYDNTEILTSNVFRFLNKTSESKTFINFLTESFKFEGLFYLPENFQPQIINYSILHEKKKAVFLNSLIAIMKIYWTFTLPNISLWKSEYLLKIMKLTQVGCHLHQRFLYLKDIYSDWKIQKSLDLKYKNLLCAIIIDLFFGWLLMFIVWNSEMPVLLLKSSLHYTNILVGGIQKLIYWLMGVPGGLKLNIPLNYALGHFFLYHIYLWEAYITLVVPVFHFMLRVSTFIGIFGLTFYLCLISDIFSIATIHIYCFYGYATRLYGYQISCLSAMWRLFRGKKWNPLRQRVDSHSYDVHQLYLGTLIFTVLLFLLPTTLVYYFVFTCLRILVLMIQGLVSKSIEFFNIFPLYLLILRLLKSSETAGEIYFSIYSSEATLVLSMQIIQAPFSSVFKYSIPEKQEVRKSLSWKKMFFSILCGDIIYPI